MRTFAFDWLHKAGEMVVGANLPAHSAYDRMQHDWLSNLDDRVDFSAATDSETLWIAEVARREAPKGIPTAPMFVPPGSVDDAQEVEAFARCVEKFMSWEGALLPHPGFGSMSHEEFEKFHAGHMAHHLDFLEIKG